MILTYKISNEIQDKSELLNWCYPNVMIDEKINISNKNSKLVKICSKNQNVKDLVKMLDMVEVQKLLTKKC